LFAFVASEAREFSGLLLHVEGLTTLDWGIDFARKGLLNGRAIVMAANGPGPKLAAQAAQAIEEHDKLEGLASIGFCGALNPALQPCDILIATSIVTEPTPTFQTSEKACSQTNERDHSPTTEKNRSQAIVAHALSVPRSHSCERPPVVLLSLDHVATTPQEKTHLRTLHNADAIEMESASLAVWAHKSQIPFYAIKVVTDTASESFPLDFNRLRTPEGRFSRPKIIAAALLHPRAIPALIHLNRRCSQASKTLGDFLADASF
jgi:adenosylhomocysteine nucleosidase